MTHLEFAVDDRELIGLQPVSPTCTLYLGRESIGENGYVLTRAMRRFGLSTVRAPGEWPDTVSHRRPSPQDTDVVADTVLDVERNLI